MIRIFAVAVLACISACSSYDQHYYSLHPELIQKALDACPQKSPRGVDCKQLQGIATRLNEAVYQLRAHPQEYGAEILTIENAIAAEESSLARSPHQSQLELSLAAHKQDLVEHLAIVKWLESPDGS